MDFFHYAQYSPSLIYVFIMFLVILQFSGQFNAIFIVNNNKSHTQTIIFFWKEICVSCTEY